ncbi:hypothetical protein COO60DRAFT_1007483 [Scenedesmus sp. NREL 46B-D3]|nr:hypothetical protein COO60DRAFT_1007483 [Scenedesmus sp. NREL 46B-D3]
MGTVAVSYYVLHVHWRNRLRAVPLAVEFVCAGLVSGPQVVSTHADYMHNQNTCPQYIHTVQVACFGIGLALSALSCLGCCAASKHVHAIVFGVQQEGWGNRVCWVTEWATTRQSVFI